MKRTDQWKALYAASFAIDFEKMIDAVRDDIKRSGAREDPWERMEKYQLYGMAERAATVADLGVRGLREYDRENKKP